MMMLIAAILLVALLSDVDIALTFDKQRKQFESQTGINQHEDTK